MLAEVGTNGVIRRLSAIRIDAVRASTTVMLAHIQSQTKLKFGLYALASLFLAVAEFLVVFARMNEMAAAGAPASATESKIATAAEQSGVSAEPGPSNEHIAAVPEPPLANAPTGEMKTSAPTAVSPSETAAAPFKAKLWIIQGGRCGQEFELKAGNNVVGRWDPETGAFPEVDLDADDPEAKVSRKHALIRIDGGKITIEDIGSYNGTYVNRKPRLQPETPLDLKDGDEIIIGKTFLKLSINPISSKASPTPPACLRSTRE